LHRVQFSVNITSFPNTIPYDIDLSSLYLAL